MENRPPRREQHDGDDEAPEVAELAVAERVLDVGWALRLAQADVQEHLVAAVGVGMDGLGQQAARARVHRGARLRQRDAEIGEKGIQNRP